MHNRRRLFKLPLHRFIALRWNTFSYRDKLFIMEPCKICSKSVEQAKLITCSGPCGLAFHFTCSGMTKSQFSAWSAEIGLLWFCRSCRLNFDPAVYDRERMIMKALRELLIRTDSMDTRLGNYGEILRQINKTQNHSKSADISDHTSFLRSINELNFDDMTDDPINRSRSCEETSFFEVLDEINSSTVHIPDKIIVGSGKRVQIMTNRPTSSDSSPKSLPRANNSTPAASFDRPNSGLNDSGTRLASPPNNANRISTNTSDDVTTDNGQSSRINREPIRSSLKVATGSQSNSEMESFYVTPFEPDQSEEDVKRHVMDVANVSSALVQVTKLVPRGKQVEDLSFVSFKVSICRTASRVVGDPWYWPDGVSVRPFEPNTKNGSAVRLPNTQ